MFGCCSSYIECSKKGYCIHLDDLEYSGCIYKVNLEQGKNYYYKEETIMELKITIANAEEIIKAINGLTEVLKVTTKAKVENPVKSAWKEEPAKVEPVKVEPVKVEPVKVEPVKVEPVKVEPVVELEDDFLSEKTYTFDEVKAKLASLSQSGKQLEMKQLIMSYGVCKLSDIPAEKYNDLMTKAEAIK